MKTFGYKLPPHIVTSAKIESRLAPLYEKLKLAYGRLEMMSGIRERRFWDASARPSGSRATGSVALQNACPKPEEIECLLHTSVCRDFLEPATATFVHRTLGLDKNAITYDISNACLGFFAPIVH